MIYLSPEQVLFIHSRIISETGGFPGVRDLGMLQSAMARPQATFDSHDLYPDLLSKVAALLDSLVNNHPFVDGNERTGITTVALYLLANGLKLNPTGTELEIFTIAVAQSQLDISSIKEWFKIHTVLQK
jgi:death-on-curing protein